MYDVRASINLHRMAGHTPRYVRSQTKQPHHRSGLRVLKWRRDRCISWNRKFTSIARLNIIKRIDPSSLGIREQIVQQNSIFERLSSDAASAGTSTNLKYPRAPPARPAQARSLSSRLSGLLTILVEHQRHHQVHRDSLLFLYHITLGSRVQWCN